MTAPSVTVIVPCWNRAASVGRTIASLRSQTVTDLEIIAVDDGSQDSSLRRLHELAALDRRLRVISQENGGPSQARNRGAALARGTYLAFLDSDDEARPDWLASFAPLDADLIVGGAIRHELDSGRSTTVLPQAQGRHLDGLPGPLLAGTFVIRRTTFEALGGYDETLHFSENTDLLYRFADLAATSSGVSARSAATARVVHHVRPDRAYDAAQFRAAEHFLDAHGSRLRQERRLLAAHHAIAGVTAGRLGRRRCAVVHLTRAVALDPRKPRLVLHLIRALVRPMRPQAAGERRASVVPLEPDLESPSARPR